MKLAIIGSRTFDNHELMNEEMSRYLDTGYGEFICREIVSGGAAGADTLGAEFAKAYRLDLKVFLPDWDKHGKSAGFIRNKEIIDYCDEVLAFWDGKSKGTANSIELAAKAKKPTTIIYF